jgi:CheY-like chemotaxis protein
VNVQRLVEGTILLPAPFSRDIELRSEFVAGRRVPDRRASASTGDAAAQGRLAMDRDSVQVVTVVDDGPLLVELAAEMIVELRCVALTFGFSEHACAAFDDMGLKIDLLLTDEKMPGFSGSELFAAIRAKGWNIPRS